MHLILYLSRPLGIAEKYHWPTDLELDGLVRDIRKIATFVKQCPRTVAYTDHRASEGIAKMQGLATSSPGKCSTRHADWAVYLSQFWERLEEVKYIKGEDLAVRKRGVIYFLELSIFL
jgi:hypothetical protein